MPHDTELLTDLVARKVGCLTELRDMGAKQLALVRGGGMTELLDLLAAKQRVLGELQRVERGLDPFRAQDPDARPWPSPQARRRCHELVERSESLLREIVDRERRSETELVRRRDETAAQLQAAHLAGQARGAYTAQPHAAGGQIDLSSES